MIEAILLIASENYYSCEITRKVPVRVSLIAINGPEGFGIIESLDGSESPLKKYARFMRRSKNILEFEITYRSASQYWTRVVHQLTDKSIQETILESGCMNRLPIIIANGKQMHTVLAPTQEEFTSMFDSLKSRFTSVELESVRRYPGGLVSPTLTNKQEEVFRLALANGYYEIPRRNDIERMSHLIGLSRVAFQERLRRAERSIMKEFARQQGLVY